MPNTSKLTAPVAFRVPMEVFLALKGRAQFDPEIRKLNKALKVKQATAQPASQDERVIELLEEKIKKELSRGINNRARNIVVKSIMRDLGRKR